MMTDQNDLSDDQKNRVEETLKRIRAGLKRIDLSPGAEPAHFFKPEALHDQK